MVNPSSGKSLFFSDLSFAYFFTFLCANTLLSYLPLSLEAKLGAGFLVLLLIGGTALKAGLPADPGKPLFTREFLPPIPFWAWGLVASAAVFARCYHLTTLFVWPHVDEATMGFYAIQIRQKGFDRLLYMPAQIPPFYPWWISLFFQAAGVSTTALSFSPLPFSLALPPLAGLVARRWGFSKSFSFLCAAFTALGLWFWYIGRFAMAQALTPLLETGVLGIASLLLKPPLPRRPMGAALLLGFSLGLVFYAVFLDWIAFALAVGLTVFWIYRRSLRVPAAFGLAGALMVLPFGFHFLRGGLPSYLSQLWTFNGGALSFSKLFVCLSYWSAVFWGLPLDFYTYQPLWGGFLNPVMGSLVFLGFLEAVREVSPLVRWLAAAFLFLLLPGVLSHDSETFRICPAAIISVPLAALGISRLLVSISTPWRRGCLLGIMLALSFVLDFYHLAGPLHRVWEDPGYWLKFHKSINQYRAFNILSAQSAAQGPGLVYSDFSAGVCDQSIDIADYAFNAALNPRLDPENARWAAVLANVNDQPFLVQRFGKGKSYWLSKDLRAPDGGSMLWIIPVSDSNRPVFRQWSQANQALNAFIDAYLQNLNYAAGDPYHQVLPSLEKAHPFFGGDPFLETCFWEKVSDLLVKSGRPAEAAAALEHAVRSGCPSAHLFYRWGALEIGLGNLPAARRAFRQALQAPLDFTQSRSLLAQISGPDSLGKGGKI